METKCTAKLSIWGGMECTINRVGNQFNDQLNFSGFYDEPQRLQQLIESGIKTCRFPILWERHQPAVNCNIDWSWATGQLNALRDYNITPVAGLLHHGSGPAFTDLLQPDFPEQFADYAGKVAVQFPWINLYTPINEPLTTARFSGLYGLWYPHKQNDVSFIKILLNEVKGIVLAMKAIRAINPSAQLVQTEDLSKTYSTPLLQYQADFENHRRWLTYDLLSGKVTPEHALWNYFLRLGIDTQQLQFFVDQPCPPNIVGVNYYVTSERYLDEALHEYPEHTYGSNEIHNYADVEAVRVSINEPTGIAVLLDEIWQRYNIPIVVTEVHLNCAIDEQVRWIKHIYNAALNGVTQGIDVRAITLWSFFGAFGWDKLLTDCPGNYERGLYDLTTGTSSPTVLPDLLKNLLDDPDYFKTTDDSPGWWLRDSRFFKSINRVNDVGENDSIPLTLD